LPLWSVIIWSIGHIQPKQALYNMIYQSYYLNCLYESLFLIGNYKFVEVPPGIANLTQLEMLNLFNNHIEELPVSLSSMPKLRILNVG